MKNKKWLALLMTAALVPFAFAGCNNGTGGEGEGAGGENPPATENDGTDKSTKLTGKIYLVGDSTVCSFSDSYYLPRYGYGTQLYNYINCDANQIVNYAVSGRSSKSFLTDSNGNYDRLKNEISTGDYLIIGFGHNDEKSDDPARFTDPNGDKDTAGSFQNTLYENYVKLATDNGATPILCTPVVRYDSSNSYTGNVVHVTANGDYAAAIKSLGEATGTTVIDLTKIMKDLYQSDNVAAQYYHAHTTYKGEKPDETPSGRDSTHLNKYGAKMVAYQLTQAVLQTNCTLKNNVITNAKAPSFESDYASAVNTSYVRPPYSSFDESTATGLKLATLTTDDTTSNWYGTAMGNVGGESKLSNFERSYSNGIFTVGTDSKSGKLEDKADGTGVDGFGAVFTPVSVSKDFTVSAHVKVKSINSTNAGNQSGFGIMLRDDIYINTSKADLCSNYVAAGIIGNSSAIFKREAVEEGTRITKESNSTTATANSEYDMTITRVGQKVDLTVQVVGGAKFTKTYTDFDFVAVDYDYMYICLFATRGDIVEFSNVRFEITGNSQGA